MCVHYYIRNRYTKKNNLCNFLFFSNSQKIGLVFTPATGNAGINCQHSSGNYVLQDAHIASTELSFSMQIFFCINDHWLKYAN